MAIDADYNTSSSLIDAHAVFILAENFFCMYFLLELIIRFSSFSSKTDAMQDGWFVFDSGLVVLSILDTWVMLLVSVILRAESGSGVETGDAVIVRLARLLRLARMARLTKVFRTMPEVLIILKGISIAFRSVFFTLFMVTVVIYVFAILFRQLSDGMEIQEQYFGSVPQAMSTLLLQGTIPDLADFFYSLSASSLLFAFTAGLFFLVASVLLMNMLVGVLVEVVNVVGEVEREQMAISFVKDRMEKLFYSAEIATTDDHKINEEEFIILLNHPLTIKALSSVDVDVIGLVDFSDFIFKDHIELTFAEFMEMVLRLRGSNSCTVKDIVDLRLFLACELKNLEELIMEELLDIRDKV
jgi:hypothetical protein